jgi:hypothetical protein
MLQVAQGGTVRIPATYEDATASLVDPGTPLVDIIDPSNAVVVNDAVPVRDSLGEYHYDFTAAAAAPLGDWVARFSGVVSGGTVTGDETFVVVQPGAVSGGPPWLIQLSELRTAMGVAPGDVDPTRDERWSQAIAGASTAIIKYTDRDFAAAAVTEQRIFEYDGSGFLDIDDCVDITDVTYSIGGYDTIIVADQWRAEPMRGEVFTYLVLPAWGPTFSPEMGFTKNVDVLYREGRFVGLGPTVKVTATWGWTTVPDDIKRATIWTAVAMADNPEPYISESIADYSHTSEARGLTDDAIPGRAKDLLAPYVRHEFG